MQSRVLANVLDLAEKVPRTYVATADRAGLPHLASGRGFALTSGGRVLLTEWFCPKTLENLEQNPRVALVVWDPEADTGYQLLGEVERIRDLSILDGYLPQAEERRRVPQVERELLIRVERVLIFSEAPHQDAPLDLGD
jgi:hypothetical protein